MAIYQYRLTCFAGSYIWIYLPAGKKKKVFFIIKKDANSYTPGRITKGLKLPDPCILYPASCILHPVTMSYTDNHFQSNACYLHPLSLPFIKYK